MFRGPPYASRNIPHTPIPNGPRMQVSVAPERPSAYDEFNLNLFALIYYGAFERNTMVCVAMHPINDNNSVCYFK